VSKFWDQIQLVIPGWLDSLEILIVAFLLYRVLLIIQRTRAMQILLGLLVLASVYLLSQLLRLTLIEYILESVFQYGVIAALVVFQPELRTALSRLGQSRLIRMVNPMQGSQLIDEIVNGVTELSRRSIGSIIAIEQEVGLDEYAQTGSREIVRVSSGMLQTIFTPGTPLHDGAVIIVGDEVQAAGAILPLTQYALTDKSLGTRHRAAIGLSEETDALVIVTSEETSEVSVAYRGRLERDMEITRLREVLSGVLPQRPVVMNTKF
jgi:diadenylate cyclase